MQNQNKILKNLIKSSINGLSEDQQNICIQLLQNCQYTSILIYILKLNTKNNGKDNVIQLINHTMQMIKQKQSICALIDYKFRISWLQIKIIEKIDMSMDGILSFLQKTKYIIFNGSIKEFIYRISKQFPDIEQQQSLMSKFEQQINKNENYHILKKIYPNKAEILQLERQEKIKFNFNKLQLMEQFKQYSSNSILDQLLQQNLFKAFQAQFCQGQNVQNPQIVYTNQDFQKFKKQLLQLSTKIKLTDCQRQLKIKSAGKQNYYYKILNIRNKIHPIYIPQLIFRTNKNSEMLIGKDVFALFGDTGVGKTTIAQILLGYTLIKCQNSSQLETLTPLNGLKAQHKDFISNNTAESVTKYLTTAKLILPQKYSDQGELYIADTPGNKDLNGISIDVANNTHTIKILNQTNSIRFGFVINQKKWGLRGEGFKSMALQISKLFIKYQQLKPIYFLNNFYQQEKLIQLIAKVKDLKQNGLNQEEKGNHKMVAVVNHFSKLMQSTTALMKKQNITVRQAIKLNQQLILIDPKNPDLKQIYQKILQKQRQIFCPKDSIAFNFSREAEQVLQFQSTNLKQITKFFISQKNVEATNYYISQLKYLINITEGTNDVARAKIKLEQIITFVQNKFQKIIQKFQNLSRQILSLHITQQLIRQAKSDKQIFCKLQKKLKIIPEMEHFHHQQKINKIIYEQITTMLELKIREQNLNINLINTIKLFSYYFVPQLMLQLNKQIQIKKSAIQNTINQAIKEQKYNCLENLVKQLEQILSFKIDSSKSTLYDNNWSQNLKARLEQRNQKCLKIIDRYKNSLSLTIIQRDALYLKESCDIFDIKSSRIKQINQIHQIFVKIKKQTIQLAKKQTKNLTVIIVKLADKNQRFQKQKAYKLKQNIEKIAKIKPVYNQINQMLQNISQLLAEKNIQIFQEFQTYFQIQMEQNLNKLKNYYGKIVDSENYAALANKQEQIQILKLVQKHKKSLTSKIQQYFKQNIQPLGTDLNILNRQLLEESLYAGKILRYIKPLSCSLGSQQTTKDDLQNLYQRMRQLLKQKLSKYLKNLKQLLQILKGYNKQIKTSQQLRKKYRDILNIERFLIIHKQIDMKQTYKIVQIFYEFNDLIKQFQEYLNTLVSDFQKIILLKLQKIIKIMEQLNSNHHNNRLCRQQIQMINEQFQLVQNIKSRRQLQAILTQKTDFAYIYNKNIKQIKIVIDQKIQKLIKKQKNNHIIQIFIQNCRILKLINQQFFKDSLNQIQKIISQYKSAIDQNLRSLIRYDGSIDYLVLRNLNEDIQSFGQNGIFVTKKQILVLKLKQYMYRQELQIKNYINKISLTQFLNKLSKIYQLYEKTQQVNRILKQNYFSISQQIITNIRKQHSANLQKIKKKINNIQQFQKQIKKNELQQLYEQYYELLKCLDTKQWKQLQALFKQAKNNFTLCLVPNLLSMFW